MCENLINESLVLKLIAAQFPQWKALPIHHILPGGWDNRCFRLGKKMVVRLPSAKRYSKNIQKENLSLRKNFLLKSSIGFGEKDA